MRIVIVGGVAGGASAAARARRLSEDCEILLIERGADPSFANCGLPYYVGGVIESRDHLLVAPADQLRRRYRLDVRTRSEVTAIDRQQKTVEVLNRDTGDRSIEAYDKLILSTGAIPYRPPIPGIDGPQVYTLRDLGDADRLHEIVTQKVGQAVVVGGGFIGIELAENLRHRGLQVTLVELADQILPPWDPEMVTPVESQLRARGIELRLRDSVTEFTDSSAGLRMQLQSGDELAADLAVVSIGVRPDNQLAIGAGLDCAPRGGVITNPHMQTNDPDIYAVGDVVQVTDVVTGDPTQIPLAGPANRQGRIAADHIFGRDSAYRGTQGTAVVGVFDMTAAMTGLSEKVLRRIKRPFAKIYIHPTHHASYYPGAQRMTLKLLFDPDDGRILGAQVVGHRGVDKRVDVLATAIQAGWTVSDLEEAELCYAPQYGSAKDAVNMAGFVAAGVLRGDHPILHWDALPAERWIVDVRTPAEFLAGHVPGAVNLPLDELRERIAELPPQQPLATYCQVGQRGYMATRLLLQRGRDVANLSGGFATWQLWQR